MFGKNEIVGQKYFDNAGDKLFVTSMFYTLQGEGPFRGHPAVFVRLAKCNLACGFCFVDSTNITMSDGKSKKIKDICIGDEVVSWDSGKWVNKKVTKLYKSQTQKLLNLEFGNKKITCTPEHPFYVRDKGWVAANELTEDDVVIHFSSSAHMKHKNPMFNEVTAKNSSERQKGKPGYLNTAWNDKSFRDANVIRMTNNNPMKNPEVAIKGFLNRKDRGKKSSTEIVFEKLVQNLPVSFVGDGSLIVDNLCPDFVVHNQKKLIEVWDEEQTEYYGRDLKWQQNRAARFKNEDYDVLFMPFSKKTDPEYIVNKVSEFVNNGYCLTNKTVINKPTSGKGPDGKRWVRYSKNINDDITVYNFEVEDTHNYLANGLLVHNCDTFFDDGDWLTFEEIDVQINKLLSKKFGDSLPDWFKQKVVLVITGGEPMLQSNITKFIEYFQDGFADVQIETNGTIYQELPEKTTLVVSPKCLEKKGVAIKYLKPNIKVMERANCLKFVMEANQDSPYSNIPDWAHEFKKDVYISPMNVYNTLPQKSKQSRLTKNSLDITERSDEEIISFWEPGLLNMQENQKNHEYAAKYCADNGFILNLQIHLYASLA